MLMVPNSRCRQRILGALTVLLVCGGCYRHEVRDFAPKAGAVCDAVEFKGNLFNMGTFHVWFNGLPAVHENREGSPDELWAWVPEGATTGPIRVRVDTGWGFVLGIFGTDHTFAEDFVVTGTPARPVIQSFSPDQQTVMPGETTTLRWSVSSPHTALTLNGDDVFGSTAWTVTPLNTTTYTLEATNVCLTAKSTVSVSVSAPTLTSLNKKTYHPEEKLRAFGSGLGGSGISSEMEFSGGGTTVTVPALSSSASVLEATVPTTLPAGPVTVRALVGGVASNDEAFTLDARTNGAFTEMMGSIKTKGQDCLGKKVKIGPSSLGGPGEIQASFSEGNKNLWTHSFKPGDLGGAGFSKTCELGAIVQMPSGGYVSDYLMLFRHFASMKQLSATAYAQSPGWICPSCLHLMSSPKGELVITSGVAPVGPGDITITIWDMVTGKKVGASKDGNCSPNCNSLSAEVITGNKVRITLHGTTVGTFPIF